MELLSFIFDLVFLVIVIRIAFALQAGRHTRQVGLVARDLDEGHLIPLTVEVDQTQYFCYNSITKAFVCQGRNLKEIVEHFKQRYPDKSAAIYDGDETAVCTLKNQLKELGENFSSVRRAS